MSKRSGVHAGSLCTSLYASTAFAKGCCPASVPQASSDPGCSSGGYSFASVFGNFTSEVRSFAVSTCAGVRHDGPSAPLHSMDLRIEFAGARIFEHAVLGAIERVARVEHGFVNRRILLGRDIAVGAPMHEPVYQKTHAHETRAWIGRRTGDDRIEIGRVLRGDGKPLIAAGRATIPQSHLRRAVVMRIDDGFRSYGQFVQRAMRVIDQFLGMADGKRAAGR